MIDPVLWPLKYSSFRKNEYHVYFSRSSVTKTKYSLKVISQPKRDLLQPLQLLERRLWNFLI